MSDREQESNQNSYGDGEEPESTAPQCGDDIKKDSDGSSDSSEPRLVINDDVVNNHTNYNNLLVEERYFSDDDTSDNNSDIDQFNLSTDQSQNGNDEESLSLSSFEDQTNELKNQNELNENSVIKHSGDFCVNNVTTPTGNNLEQLNADINPSAGNLRTFERPWTAVFADTEYNADNILTLNTDDTINAPDVSLQSTSSNSQNVIESTNDITPNKGVANVNANIFVCTICQYESTNAKRFCTHMKTHTDIKTYTCTYCGNVYSTKSNLSRHLKNHNAEKPYSCTICSYKCVLNQSLKQHMKIHTGEKPFACKLCAYKCTQRQSLIIHMKRHTGEKPFFCKSCPFTSNLKKDVVKHMKSHKDGLLSCKYCPYKFAQKQALILHMRGHTEGVTYSCKLCPYKCMRRQNFIIHLKTHSAQKPYSCDQCPYRCSNQTILYVHKRNHANSDTKYTTSNDISLFSKHIKYTQDVEKKIFMCKFCDFGAATKLRLISHLKIHAGEKPYLCVTCGHKCVHKGRMLKHMRTHAIMTPYECHHCPYKFNDKSALQLHMKQHDEALESIAIEENSDSASIEQNTTPSDTPANPINDTKYEIPTIAPIFDPENQMSIVDATADVDEFINTKANEVDIKANTTTETSQPDVKNANSLIGAKNVVITFTCHICQLKTKSRKLHLAHMKIHNGVRTYRCHYCGNVYSRIGNLSRHLKKHNKGRPHSCPICPYTSVLLQNLKQHMKIHAEKKQFSCKICNYKCMKYTNLLLHMDTHNGDTLYTCEHCRYQTKLKKDIINHMKTHTKDKNDVYQFCPFTFSCQQNVTDDLLEDKFVFSDNNETTSDSEIDVGESSDSYTLNDTDLRTDSDQNPITNEPCLFTGNDLPSCGTIYNNGETSSHNCQENFNFKSFYNASKSDEEYFVPSESNTADFGDIDGDQSQKELHLINDVDVPCTSTSDSQPKDSVSEVYVCQICHKSNYVFIHFLNHLISHVVKQKSRPMQSRQQTTNLNRNTPEKDYHPIDNEHNIDNHMNPQASTLITSDTHGVSQTNQTSTDNHTPDNHTPDNHTPDANNCVEENDNDEMIINKKDYICNLCECNFTNKSQLYNHIFDENPSNSEDNSEDKSNMNIDMKEYYRCHICNKVFESADELSAHMMSMHDAKSTSDKIFDLDEHVCNESDKTDHALNCTNMKPVACANYENSDYERPKSELEKEKKTRMPYNCDQCDYSSQNRWRLILHVMDHSEEIKKLRERVKFFLKYIKLNSKSPF